MIIHHIGIIATNMTEAIAIYNKLGYKLTIDIFDDVQKNRIAFLESDFSVRIELIEAMDSSSSIYNFKEGYHHICYEVESGEDIIQKFKGMKIGKIFTAPVIAPGLDNRKVIFACLQNGTLIEFVL